MRKPKRKKSKSCEKVSVGIERDIANSNLIPASYRQTSEIMEKIFSITSVLFAFMDAKFNFIRVNRAYAEADNHAPEFFAGKNHFELYPNEENEAIFRHVVETGEPYFVSKKPFVYPRNPERGVTYWDWSLLPVKGDSGEVEALLLRGVNVTERVRMEEELRMHRDRLEELAEERTAQLAETNAKLQHEIIEHEQAHQETLDANEKLTDVLSSISDGFFVLDNRLLITYYNKAAEELLGRKAEDVLGRPLFEAFPEAKGSIFEQKYTYALQNEVSLSFEVYFGVAPLENWYDVRVYPFKGGISVYFRVTTARKEAEENLRKSEEKIRLITNSLPVLISYIDANQCFQFNNKAYESWFGRPAFAIQSKPVKEILGDAAYGAIQPYIETALSGKFVRFETVIEKSDGTSKSIEATFAPHITGDGRILGFFSLMNDISERKQSEIEREQLRQQAEEDRDKLIALLNTVSDEIWFCDTEGNISLYNMAATKSGSIFDPADIPQSLPELLATTEIYTSDGEPRPKEDAPLLRSLHGETIKGFEEIIRVPHTKELRYREGSSTPLRCRDGKIIGAVAAIRDITYRKMAERALRESEARYKELVLSLEEKVNEKVAELKRTETLAAIGRMVSVVAHEVRNPLQGIGMGVQILNAEMGQDKSKSELLEDINYSVKTLNGIIIDLLNYARPIELKVAPVRVADLVQDALNVVKQRLRNVTMEIDLDQPEKEILVDGSKLIQVLVNLLANAADAMPNGGTLTVRSSIVDKNTFRLRVSDTGHGIEEQNMERIFEPFFTTKTRGTGLGLAICRRMVEAHHGILRIMSEVGNGTTAEIILPLPLLEPPEHGQIVH
jgi:PAS domain S-box-containing protein